MILGVPVNELLLLAALIIAGGFVTGILAGLFGIGGGALILHTLITAMGVSKVVASEHDILDGIALRLAASDVGARTTPRVSNLVSRRPCRSRTGRYRRLPAPSSFITCQPR